MRPSIENLSQAFSKAAKRGFDKVRSRGVTYGGRCFLLGECFLTASAFYGDPDSENTAGPQTELDRNLILASAGLLYGADILLAKFGDKDFGRIGSAILAILAGAALVTEAARREGMSTELIGPSALILADIPLAFHKQLSNKNHHNPVVRELGSWIQHNPERVFALGMFAGSLTWIKSAWKNPYRAAAAGMFAIGAVCFFLNKEPTETRQIEVRKNATP